MENCSFSPTVDEGISATDLPVVNGHIFRKIVLVHIQRHNMTRPVPTRTRSGLVSYS
ncbi:hypothetical protein GQ600_18381 [Phytophthora cactorum]|nr:hypothetical protein GQ600_18381 [Phytophthora cactorum]